MRILHRLRSSFVFWVLLAYALAGAGHLAYLTGSGAEQAREARGFFLQHALKTGRPLLKDGRTRELTKYFKDAVSTGLVDYFEIEQKSKTEKSGWAPEKRPVLAEALTEADGWIWARAENEDTTLRLATGFGWRSRLLAAVSAEIPRLPFQFALLFFVCALGAYFQAPAKAANGNWAPRRSWKRAKLARAEGAAAKGPQHEHFEGVCGRASLLHLAELVGKEEGAAFFTSLEEFYADASALVARYRGRVQAAHGHELLFFFPGGEPKSRARRALAAARDLQALAEQRGLQIAVALAAGNMHGGSLLSGYALFGPPVEGTAELLPASPAKASAVLTSKTLARAAGGKAENLGDFAAALGEAKAGRSAELAFHRGDQALATLLFSLANDRDWTRECFLGAVAELRSVECRRGGPAVTEAYRHLLAAELTLQDSYRLSSALSLGVHLLSAGTVDRPMEKLFLRAVSLKDARVRANAVDFFTRFFPERDVPELRSLLRDEDNRVAANALIKAACQRLDDKIISRIEERVRAGTVAQVASVLHAVGEIALYYRNRDPLFLGTKVHFLRLFEGVPHWARHPSPMIRRQALLAARKLASESVDGQLFAVFHQSDDPELLALFHEVYGWRKEEAVKAPEAAA